MDSIDIVFVTFVGTLILILVLVFGDASYHHWEKQHIEQECERHE